MLTARLRALRSALQRPVQPVEQPLVVGDSQCGGAFLLDRAATASCQEVLSHGWTAELISGSSQVTVRGPGGVDDYDDAFAEAVAAAQESLDLLAMRGGQGLAVESADTEHVAWWTDGAGRRVLRMVAVSDLGVSMSVAATVTDKDGKVVPQPAPPALPWHESLRYFRLAQVTGDLFDAYRNMYLALESLLSTVVPPKLHPNGKPGEGEGQWLRRALTTVDSSLLLDPYAPSGPGPAVDRVFDDIYAGTRTQLFHAKSGRPVLLPHGIDSRDGVLASLERLARLFLDLFAHHTGHRRPSGAMTYVGFELMTSFETTVMLSDDPAAVDKADEVINPTGGASAVMPTHRSSALSKPGVTFWLGELDLRATHGVPRGPARRVGLTTDDGVLLQVQRLTEPVALPGIDVLQVQLGARLVNSQQPRFRFST